MVQEILYCDRDQPAQRAVLLASKPGEPLVVLCVEADSESPLAQVVILSPLLTIMLLGLGHVNLRRKRTALRSSSARLLALISRWTCAGVRVGQNGRAIFL